MAQMTMTEKDMLKNAYDREHQITLKIMRAFPPAQGDLRPAPKSRTARELGWTIVLTERVVDPIIKGALTPEDMPEETPPSWNEIISTFETVHRETLKKLDRLSDNDINGMVRMPVGPNKTGEVRRANALWMMLQDQIHHRGQLSVYLRIAGAKVPAISGPSLDEPWI